MGLPSTFKLQMDPADKSELVAHLDATTMGEVQLVLAEKRTALATLRTGLAIFAFPLGVLSVLIATSQSYKIHEVLHWMIPLLLLNLGLIGAGGLSPRSSPSGASAIATV